jgi:hypothetical protein
MIYLDFVNIYRYILTERYNKRDPIFDLNVIINLLRFIFI